MALSAAASMRRPQCGALNAAPSMRRMPVWAGNADPIEMRARFGNTGDGNSACEHKLWQLPSRRRAAERIAKDKRRRIACAQHRDHGTRQCASDSQTSIRHHRLGTLDRTKVGPDVFTRGEHRDDVSPAVNLKLVLAALVSLESRFRV